MSAATAPERRGDAWRQVRDTRHAHDQQLARYGRLAHTENPQQRLHELDHTVTTLQAHLAAAATAIDHLTADPAIASLPQATLSATKMNGAPATSPTAPPHASRP